MLAEPRKSTENIRLLEKYAGVPHNTTIEARSDGVQLGAWLRLEDNRLKDSLGTLVKKENVCPA